MSWGGGKAVGAVDSSRQRCEETRDLEDVNSVPRADRVINFRLLKEGLVLSLEGA